MTKFCTLTSTILAVWRGAVVVWRALSYLQLFCRRVSGFPCTLVFFFQDFYAIVYNRTSQFSVLLLFLQTFLITKRRHHHVNHCTQQLYWERCQKSKSMQHVGRNFWCNYNFSNDCMSAMEELSCFRSVINSSDSFPDVCFNQTSAFRNFGCGEKQTKLGMSRYRAGNLHRNFTSAVMKNTLARRFSGIMHALRCSNKDDNCESSSLLLYFTGFFPLHPWRQSPRL